MSNTASGTKDTNSAKTDKADISHHENQKGVEFHKKAAEHHEAGAHD
jgi:hypothetical protein